MKRFRSLVLTAAALLFIAACSAPEDLTTPTLSPQFGTTGNDTVEDVAYGKAGHLYAVGAWDSSNDVREQSWNVSYGADAYLRRYDRSGNMVWEKFYDIEPAYRDDIHEITANVVAVDGSGNAFVAWSATYYERVYDDAGGYYRYNYLATFHYLSKYSARGTRLWRVNTGNNVINDLATDSSGNVYATSNNVDFYSNHYLTKYTASGARSWQKVNGVRPTGVAVSSTNNIYTVREDGYVLKYNSSGTQLWAKTTALDGRNAYKIAAGVGDELYIVGAYNYHEEVGEGCDDSTTDTYYYARLYKLSSTGARQWYRNAAMMQTYDDACGNNSGWFPQYGLNVATDSLGNAYIATGASTGDAVVTKHNRSGTLLWSKAFGSGYPLDGATSVATYDGSEVFVGAVTYGSLAHRNLGGSDAVLREMNGSGNRVWTR